MLNDLDPASLAFGQILRRLQEICKSRMFVPSSHVLRVDLLNTDKSPFASGGFSDVFQGTYGGSKVCVKRLRVSSTSSPERVKKGSTQSLSTARCFLIIVSTDAPPRSLDMEAIDTR